MDSLTSVLSAPQVTPWLALGITMGAVFAGFYSKRRPGLVILVSVLLFAPIPLTVLGVGAIESFQSGIPLARTAQSGIFVAMLIFLAMGIGFFPIGWTIGALIAFVCVKVWEALSSRGHFAVKPLLQALAPCILVLVVVFGWMAAYPTYTYRYRMTVTVEVDGQSRSASSVVEIKLKKQPKILSDAIPVVAHVRGDAVLVDLGDGRNVFALLTSGPLGHAMDHPKTLVPRHFNLSYDLTDLAKYPKLQGRWELSAAEMPTFVTLSDLNNPNTFRVVPPGAFAQMLGDNVQLRGVTLEMTTDPVTRGLEQKLPWVARTISQGLGGAVTGHPQQFIINVPYFVRTGGD